MFWINLPICAAAIVLTTIFVPETKSATMRNIDPIGQALAVLFLFGVVFALIEGPGWAGRNARVLVVAASWRCWRSSASCATSPGATTRSSTCASSAASPLRRRRVTAICAFAAWGAFLFMMSLYLQAERGFSAMQTGLIYLPIAVGALLFSPLSGRLVGRYGARPSLLVAGRVDHRAHRCC